jgi:L-fuculose-phosphate aldolase
LLAEMTVEDVSVIALDGSTIEGSEPTSEVALHLGVYARYGAGAVVHTHAPMATALSCVLDELPCVHYGMLALGGSVRVAPYATFGTDELAASVLDALDGRSAAMMANHGTVTLGADVAGAVAATELLEWASTVYFNAAQIGTPRVLGEADQAAVIEAVVQRGYGRR